MALPNPTAQAQMTPIGMVQYQQASFKESIANAMKGFGELSAMRMLTKSPLLRMIGGGAIAESVDIKRRERLASAGRDPNTGRKLTKDELFEREARKKDLGALAEIKEILQALKITENGGIVRVAVAEGGLGGGVNRLFLGGDRSKQINIAPSEVEDTYSLADEERDAEREREDDEDQLESEERQQGFFSKLFGGMRPDRDGNGGLMSLLMGVVSSIGSVIGNIVGFLKDGVVGLLGTVFDALGGFGKGALGGLSAFGGVLIPLLLATAAGFAIRSWIDGLIAEKEKDAKIAMGETRIKRGYETTDAQGNKKFLTAKDLGKTEEELADLASKGTTTIDVDGKKVDTREIMLEERLNRESGKYEFTDVLGAGATTEQKERFLGSKTSMKSVSTAPKIGGNIKEQEEQQKALFNLEADMINFTNKVRRDRDLLDQEEITQVFANEWNSIRDRAKKLVDGLSGPRRNRAIQVIDEISNKHNLFKGLVVGNKITSSDAEFGGTYINDRDGGSMSQRGLRIPGSNDSFGSVMNKDNVIAIGPNRATENSGMTPSMQSTSSTSMESLSPSIEAPPRPTQGVAPAIGNLESSRAMPSSAPTNIVTTTNSNTNNSGGNVLMAPLNTAAYSTRSGVSMNRIGIPLTGQVSYGR